MYHAGNKDTRASQLASCYKKSLEIAVEHNLKSIVRILSVGIKMCIDPVNSDDISHRLSRVSRPVSMVIPIEKQLGSH